MTLSRLPSLKRIRKEFVSKAEGRCLEIGIGTGLNLQFYAAEINLVGTDVNPTVSKILRDGFMGKSIQISKVSAESLPYQSNEFDSVVATLVLCTVPSFDDVIKEVYRVLTPGGRFILVEHIRSSNRWVGLLQDTMTPIWKLFAGGCHLNRNPIAKAVSIGFQIKEERDFWANCAKAWVLQKV